MKNIPNRIFLVGPMGAGKTTIGRQLARQLKKEFLDSDREIETRTGADIPLIFELEGEQGFRSRECKMIDELTQKNDIVLATGGGAVLNEENRKHLKSRGCVLYLFASLDHLFERTVKDKNRPLLQTENPRQRIQEILEKRDPLYREVADVIVETGGQTIHYVVQQILKQLKNR
jgi:shikimate kinase